MIYRTFIITESFEAIENKSFVHRISIAAYAIEQQWWQSGVPKDEMSLIFKNNARSLERPVTMWLSVKNLLTRQ
jgi:hypothetical protein